MKPMREVLSAVYGPGMDHRTTESLERLFASHIKTQTNLSPTIPTNWRGKIHRNRKQTGGFQGLGEERKWGACLLGKVLLWSDGNVLELSKVVTVQLVRANELFTLR